ncbi:MAG: hypothetical protein AAF570_26530, partial [Bacteroidota bacterium]
MNLVTKALTFAYCLFFFSSTAFSQIYSLFDPSQPAYFESAWNSEMDLSDGVRFDSSVLSLPDVHHYNYKIVDSIAPPPNNPMCEFGKFENGWLGEKVIESPGGLYTFLTKNQDSVWLQSQANVGTSFTFMRLSGGNEIVAEVTAVNFGSILGQNDSIKVFELEARDNMGQTIAHPLNQKEIHVSRSWGLTRALRFYDLPNDATELNLAGLENPDLGRKNISIRQIRDYQVGDTFQYIASHSFFAQSTDTAYYEYSILSRYVSATEDTMRYEVRRRRW